MEHVPGHSCAELLRDRGHLDVDQAVEIIAQACRGLDYAHRHGVVHRDVKPGNLLVSDSERRQARRLRDRPRDRPVEHHPGRVGARNRRLPRPRAGARRGGGPARRHLFARGRRLPAALGPAAIRGHLALRAGAQAAARGADAAGPSSTLESPTRSRTRSRWPLAIDQEHRPRDAIAVRRGAAERGPRD